jgi:hypothetical protein
MNMDDIINFFAEVTKPFNDMVEWFLKPRPIHPDFFGESFIHRPRYMQIFALHYKDNSSLFHFMWLEYAVDFKNDLNPEIEEAGVIPYLICNCFDTIDNTITRQQENDYIHKLKQLKTHLYRFNFFVKYCFKIQYKQYIIAQNIVRARDALKILREKYLLCDDVCEYIQKMIA